MREMMVEEMVDDDDNISINTRDLIEVG